jgi:hypothetical protein
VYIEKALPDDFGRGFFFDIMPIMIIIIIWEIFLLLGKGFKNNQEVRHERKNEIIIKRD